MLRAGDSQLRFGTSRSPAQTAFVDFVVLNHTRVMIKSYKGIKIIPSLFLIWITSH